MAARSDELTIDQVRHFWRLVDEGLVTRVNFQAYLEQPNKFAIPPADPIFKVEVDYGKTLAEMIESGRYDWTNDDITSKRFPIRGEGKVERALVLVHPNRMVSTDEALSELDRRGLRPAKIEELLALGITRPELQKEFPIVALGSHWVDPHGDRYFAYLDWDDDERNLRLRWYGNVWYEIYRFLAVRK